MTVQSLSVSLLLFPQIFLKKRDIPEVLLSAKFFLLTDYTFRGQYTEAIIFSCKPTPGATSGEVRVKDMFGNEYVRAIEWKDNQ